MTLHFGDRDAASHVAQRQVEGLVSHAESHGVEVPGHISAGADAARESGLLFALLWLIGTFFSIPEGLSKIAFLSFCGGWLVWKTGRSALLGWSRLAKLHRIIEQEKYEIENNRAQEREELAALYRLKGFEGKLLEDVLDVLMADEERLLKVMLEEELGLTLAAHQHPLKQACGAFLGTLLSIALTSVLLLALPYFGMPLASAILLFGGALVAARYEKHYPLSSIVWNFSLAALSLGIAYFILSYHCQ